MATRKSEARWRGFPGQTGLAPCGSAELLPSGANRARPDRRLGVVAWVINRPAPPAGSGLSELVPFRDAERLCSALPLRDRQQAVGGPKCSARARTGSMPNPVGQPVAEQQP